MDKISSEPIRKINSWEIEEITFESSYNQPVLFIKLFGENAKSMTMGNKGGFYLNLGFFEDMQKVEFDANANERIMGLLHKETRLDNDDFKKMNWFVKILEEDNDG
ncbi:hypothetical protein FEZ51_01955 [Pediococcus stilesii]|uniref:Uncharacterized protein n=1 Tax=Pediococcus stilesii TaxID=331679 RepID=A0A5R9BXS7_9LACO|nr:hypothetical protein [Pediococcus stilesii]TLQ05447.1 hypothetical protein FEZ51_01955 [Pediococcus stilesii]